MIVYLATNLVNGMQYVGVTTKKLKYRKNGHFRDANRGRGSKHSLQNAIRIYGQHSFKFEKIDDADNYSALRKKEMAWIKKLKTLYPDGYNLNIGGNLRGEIKNRKYKHVFALDGKKYYGMKALADSFGLTRKTVEARFYSSLNWTTRQIVGLDPAPKQVPVCAREIIYKGIKYKSRTHLVRALSSNLSPAVFLHRLNSGMSVEEALTEKKYKGNAKKIMWRNRMFQSVSEAANFAGLPVGTVLSRLSSGKTIEEALSKKNRIQEFRVFGQTFKNKKAAADHYGIKDETLYRRLRMGFSPEEALLMEKQNSIN